jgi:hypothetical protein
MLVHTFGMPIERRDISDAQFEETLFQILVEHGFSPTRSGDLINLKGVGVDEGDHSVDLAINLVEMDAHRVLEFSCILATLPLSFDEAVLISAHGNQTCLTVKFAPVENLDQQLHQVKASMVVFADDLAKNELASMLYLFIKEVDAVDNQLIQMSSKAARRR